MNLHLNKVAPIIPGVGLGGLRLGASEQELCALLQGKIPSRDFVGEVSYTIADGAIILGFDSSTRLLFRLSAFPGYEGTFLGEIRLGDEISTLLQRNEEWVYDEWHEGYGSRRYDGVIVVPVLGAHVEGNLSRQIIGEISVFSQEFTRSSLA